MSIKQGCWVHSNISGRADSLAVEHDQETGAFICNSRGVAEGKGVFALYEGSNIGTLGRCVGFTDFIGAFRWLDGCNLKQIEHMRIAWLDQETIAAKVPANRKPRKRKQ